MKTTLTLCALAGLALAPAAFADSVYRTSASEQDTNGNYTTSTTSSRVDANGNSVRVDTGLSQDAQGNASVSKRVERSRADAYGTTKSVTHRTADTNGNEKVSSYQERTQ